MRTQPGDAGGASDRRHGGDDEGRIGQDGADLVVSGDLHSASLGARRFGRGRTVGVHNGGMHAETQSQALAGLAGLLADDTRAAFCLALFDGRAWTAGELARHAGVARSTASEHLDKLAAGGLVVERRQGRHRYVELAGAGVAELLEDLMAHLEPCQERPRTFRAVATADALARARTCYDHLAGRLGVAVTEAMTRKGLLDRDSGFALTEAGGDWLGTLGIDVADLRRRKRPVVRVCVDWTERRPHLAGGAGAQIFSRFHANGWVRRIGDGRALLVTPTGQAALRDLLEIDGAWL
jgi:DNA-binding transcriptional ArsR family regulator